MTPPLLPTIPHRALHQATVQPDGIAYCVRTADGWQSTTWRTYVAQMRTVGRGLLALGLPRGGAVAILGFNRPAWVVMHHGAMLAGAASAGIYTTSSAEEVAHIVDHCEAHTVLVEDAAQLAKLDARRAALPRLRWIVLMDGAAVPADRPEDAAAVLTWAAFLARATAVDEAALQQRIDAIEQADLATLIYTSGTTGPPKGVMLSHGNLAWTAQVLADVGCGLATDRSLSYLPLSHIAEQMATIHVPATVGSTVYFAESLDRLADNLKEVRPTVFFGVPRIWEKFHAALAGRMAALTGVTKHLMAFARAVATQKGGYASRGARLPRVLAMQYAIANTLVLRKLKQAIGMDAVRTCISGAAPIAPDVLAFFQSIDLPIQEIYGQSEDSGPTTFNLPGKTRLGTVGTALPGVEVRIADDGEVMVRGPNVFLGYLKEPEATTEARTDGWLRSGDLGAFDADGFLTITGRKKDLIITAGGTNIAPRNLEAGIKRTPLAGEVVVIGDRRKHLTALITLDAAAVSAFLAGRAAPGSADARTLIDAELQRTVDAVNATVARVEQIKQFTILPRPFGIDTGELTPTLKVKRSVVATKYAAEIDAMYGD